MSGLQSQTSRRDLQFKRTTSMPPELVVDWEEVQATLDALDPQFADPRFDPLKHALRLLGSITAEEELNELRGQWRAVDELVDTVVEAHHSGFNKSLQNYSEILRMFSESRTQLSALRRALESTQIRLHPKSEALREVYRRHLMLGDMVRLLEDVQSVVGVPDTVRQLADRKEWSLAVSTLLSGCNKAARQELSGVGALQQVRRELAAQRHSLVAAMTAELEVRAYDTSSAVSGGARHHASPVKGTVDGHVSTQAPSTVPRRQRPAALISDVNADATDGAQQFTVARPLHRRAATLGGGLPLPTMSPMKPGAGGAGAGHLLDADVSVVTLVNCIAQLGGVPSVLEAVRARMARKVRAQVISALEAFPKSKWAPDRSRGRLGTPSKTPLGEDTALLAPIAASLVASVFDSCFAVLQSVARLLQMLALAKPPAASAGLEMVLAAEGQAQIHGHSTTTSAGQSDSSRADSTGAGDALKECKFAWEVLQLECQALLAAVFGAPAPARRLRRVTAEVPTDGWLASVAMLEADDPDVAAHSAPLGALDAGSSMTFSLEEEFKTHLVPRAVTSTGAAAAPTSGHGGVDVPADYETFIAMIFGGQKGSAELAAAIYHPTIKLVEAAERLLGNVAETSKSPSSGGGSAARKTSLLQSSWRGSAGADASPRANAALLSSYLETFLRMEFLPAVYVSSRARSRALLEGGDALTPRLRLRGAYTPGAAVLPAASGAVRMAEELLGWATSVPPFAPNLAGVLENILGQVLEAFQAQANAAFGSALAGRLAEDVAAVQIMAKEPTAPLLGPPVAFNVAKEADAMDSFVSSAIAAGFGARERSLPRDLVARVLAYKPVQAGALLYTNGDATRLTALASLADSADYIADAIHASAAAAAFPAAAKTDGQSSPGSSGTPTRVGEVWLRHLGGLLRGPERREMDRGYAEGLAHAADRFRSLAGLCIRALRLELMLLAVFHLQSLPQLAAGGERATGAEDHVASLARAVAQLSEALGAYLPMERRLYVFASLPPAVMQIAVSMLPDFTTIDTATVTRVCRLLSALQPVLAASATDQDGIDPGDAAEAQQQSMDASRALEKAKLYYSLLTHSPEALLTAVAQKPRRFACDEYEALFKANMVGRRVTGEHVGRLQQVLTAAAVGR